MNIELDGVRLRYGKTVALDGLTLNLPGGRIYGLLGRNGSGKTSLLSLLAGFRRPTAGTVRVGGHPVFENGTATAGICLIRETLDMAHHSVKVKEVLEVAENLRATWDGDYAGTLLEKFQVLPGTSVGALSRGKLSALGVTVGLASRTPVTLFDESYLGMDAPARYLFRDEVLADFMQHPRTIVLATHLIEEVAPLFEQVVIIDRGRLVLHEDADDLRARGVAVTGPAAEVDRFVAGLTVLGEQQLGPTKAVTVYGELDDDRRRAARERGLELGPIALQDLFVHLTAAKGEPA
ncbi:ABC transporter ATP-binding protein [Actinomadura craniellae]|uniref:ABC transporter ATP-binding protein n=1 Tax=Actinomadura craniellae TaxID=2231787 RepID=A0A365HAC6_9ACTN|nr:ABC transporter ATP-binding protein [Actinomadura craniellae]RAY15958.1 ABC transporter ATP-binding protein [Actinomadura craniellae]